MIEAASTTDDDEVARGLYRTYVVALEAEVMNTRKFAEKNPGYRPGQPCYFVDVTDRAADLRFDQHMHGIKDNAFVRMYGAALRPDFTVDLSAVPVRGGGGTGSGIRPHPARGGLRGVGAGARRA